MAVDYKTLKAIAVSQAADADSYCPECGQPVGRLVRASCRPATSRMWWSGILAALGLYLAVAFGLQAWGAQRLAAVRLEDLRQVASKCTRPAESDSRCSDLAAARGLDPVLRRLARYATADREARSDLAVAAAGLFAALAGMAAATRPLFRAWNGDRASAWVRVLGAAPGMLALGASVMVPGAQLLLVASVVLTLARLLQGAPPSAELAAWSVHRVIELIAAIVQNA
jgi:hypothetical protein